MIHNLNKAGRKSFPYADNAVRIAKALGTTVKYLVTGEEPPVERPSPELAEMCRMLEGLSRDQLAEIRGVVRSYIQQNFAGHARGQEAAGA